MPPKSRTAVRKPRRKEKKNVSHGQAHIKSTFNNTIVSITDPSGAGDDLIGARRPDAVDVAQRDVHPLVAGKVDAGDACHS